MKALSKQAIPKVPEGFDHLILVGLGSCGISAGAMKVHKVLEETLSKTDLKVSIQETGCVGMCYREVIVDVVSKDGKMYTYGNITEENAPKLIEEHIANNAPIENLLVRSTEVDVDEATFFSNQRRIVLRNCGVIDPEKIEDYIARNGYKAIRKALKKMTREEVIDEILKSGLAGRGGAGFPTGLKWKFAYNNDNEKKYMICNADEGDPGAFMDRSVLESDPHSVIEGMMIGAYAIGANEGYIYVRNEYPLAVKRLQIAIEQAKAKKYLGKKVMGTDFSFELHIKEGAGAFVCGEETALVASIEGHRGMPRLRPPFPAESGLWAKPTNINNVETLANVPWIINNGQEKYSSLGTERSRGTKVFALAGKIVRGGLVEVPMGIPIRDVIFKVGGGIKNGRQFKAVQMGGPSGGCIPESLIDTIVDYDEVNKTGAIMGSGGMVVMDDTNCMVDIAKFFLDFTQKESCGKCTFCRVGTKRMLEILTKITEGKGKEGDIELLLDLSEKIKLSSLCGLGQTAPNPVLTTIKYFRDEYEAHINDKKCPAGHCKALLNYKIDEDKCVGCTLCAKACPVDAIKGKVKQPHVIDQEKCIKCGSCIAKCRFKAILTY